MQKFSVNVQSLLLAMRKLDRFRAKSGGLVAMQNFHVTQDCVTVTDGNIIAHCSVDLGDGGVSSGWSCQLGVSFMEWIERTSGSSVYVSFHCDDEKLEVYRDGWTSTYAVPFMKALPLSVPEGKWVEIRWGRRTLMRMRRYVQGFGAGNQVYFNSRTHEFVVNHENKLCVRVYPESDQKYDMEDIGTIAVHDAIVRDTDCFILQVERGSERPVLMLSSGSFKLVQLYDDSVKILPYQEFFQTDKPSTRVKASRLMKAFHEVSVSDAQYISFDWTSDHLSEVAALGDGTRVSKLMRWMRPPGVRSFSLDRSLMKKLIDGLSVHETNEEFWQIRVDDRKLMVSLPGMDAVMAVHNFKAE